MEMPVKVQHLGQILFYCTTDYDFLHVLIPWIDKSSGLSRPCRPSIRSAVHIVSNEARFAASRQSAFQQSAAPGG
jgi:hypothetical protein